MAWRLQIAKRAEKALEKFPNEDRHRILSAMAEMRENPFTGDIARLKSERSTFRRRIGNYRIFFDVYPDKLIVDVVEIQRRTSKTY